MPVAPMSAEEFRAALAALGWSQHDAADRLGISAGQPRISEWCSGGRAVPLYVAAHVRTLLHAASARLA